MGISELRFGRFNLNFKDEIILDVIYEKQIIMFNKIINFELLM